MCSEKVLIRALMDEGSLGKRHGKQEYRPRQNRVEGMRTDPSCKATEANEQVPAGGEEN